MSDGRRLSAAAVVAECAASGDVVHIVGFSGGIDSQACLHVVRKRFGDRRVIALNSDVGGHEHPITTEFIWQFSAEVFPVETVTPLIKDLGGRGTRPGATKDRRDRYADDDVLTFERLAEIKGIFPSRQKQFCTEYLKLVPAKRWCRDNVEAFGVAYERYAGVRCDESNKRKGTPDRMWDDVFHCWLNYPIRCWTKDECFAVCKAAGEPINPLYTMGFGRVGCAPCINSGKEDVRQWAARFPEMIDKVRAWERRVGKTFFMPVVPGMKINWVDDVVRWSRTERGGKQFSLPIVEAEADRGECSSRYGLCE